MRMPQFEIENEEIIGRILRITIGVISRRTSEAYASVAIGNAVKNLRSKYVFLNFIEVKNTKFMQFNEFFDAIEIKPEINNANPIEVAKATSDFVRMISKAINSTTIRVMFGTATALQASRYQGKNVSSANPI